jgi:conjugal transfer pilus assembly protein TraF
MISGHLPPLSTPDSKHTGERAPVGFGVMALTEIANRLFVLTGTQPGDRF